MISARRLRRKARRATRAALPLVVAVLALYLVLTAALARTELTRTKAYLTALPAAVTAGDDVQTASLVTASHRATRRAGRLLGGPVWGVLAHAPWVGAPVRTARGLAKAAQEVTDDVLPPAVAAAHHLQAFKSRNAFDLTVPVRVEPQLAAASTELARIATEVHALPKHTGLTELDSSRSKVSAVLDQAASALSSAQQASQILPGMLGADGPRRYFVGFQTNAEARPTGGLLGAYAIVVAEHGRLTVTRVGSDTDFPVYSEPLLDLGPQYTARYGPAAPTQRIANSNLSPHFPYAAAIWAATWERYSGEHVDGVIAADPVALAQVLDALGPVHLKEGVDLDARSVVRGLEADLYSSHPDQATRKALFREVASLALDKLLSAPQSRTSALLRGLAVAVDDHRLLVWSSRPGEQATLDQGPLAGALPDTSAPFLRVGMTNTLGSKLDYYLDQQITWSAGPCTGPQRRSRVTITVTNTAPPRGLPVFVTSGDFPPQPVVGTEIVRLSVWGTRGAQLRSAELQGRPALVNSDQERSHPVFSTTLALRPQTTTTLVLDLLEPTAEGAPSLQPQALVIPPRLHVDVPRC